MSIETTLGWEELSEHDKAEVKKFETFLKNQGSPKLCRCCGTKPAGVGDVCRFCYVKLEDKRPSVWTKLDEED